MTKIFYILLVGWIVSSCTYNKNIPYIEVVGRMTDLERLAILPVEGETSGMFSSYDRRSKYDEKTGTYIDWSANNDGFSPQYIRKEGENMVLAEMKGPAAIVRIWSANPSKGNVKIYVDGDSSALIDQPFRDYFNPEKLPVFSYPQLVYETAARGFNNYVPITFQDSIKILGEPGWGQYYHFNYIQFPDGTVIEPFDSSLSDSNQKALQQVNDLLAKNTGESNDFTLNSKSVLKPVELSPGDEKLVLELKGKKAITGIRVVVPDKYQTADVLRKTTLSIHWDGQEYPAVWSPLGDFFGSAPGFNPYQTLPMGMLENGTMYSNWYMPFSENAIIHFKNKNDFPIELNVKVFYEKHNMKTGDFAQFHAKWHRDIDPVDTSRWPDWTVVKTDGKGRFVGMFLSVWNPKGGHCNQFGGEGQHWWGEGDEKFFVDGEKFPSTFGTGTEDYFGYAWCVPNYFEHAFHSQNFTQDNMGYQSLNRWQIIDNVPFQKSFEGYLEKYFPNHWPTQYAAVAYWYLDPDGNDPIHATPVEERFGYEIPYAVFRAKNALEGEAFQIVSNSGGWVTTDAFCDESLYQEISGHKTLRWFARDEGDNELICQVDFTGNGKYVLWANLLCSKDGGRFKITLNNTELPFPIDCNAKIEAPQSKLVKLGTVEISGTEQQIKIEWLGELSKGKRLDIDYIRLAPL